MRRGLTQFELIVLLAMLRVGDDAYGVSIGEKIRATTGRRVAMASLYVTLDRLRADGLVASELGEPTSERGGRAKRYFHMTPKGLAEVRAARRVLTALWSTIPEPKGRAT